MNKRDKEGGGARTIECEERKGQEIKDGRCVSEVERQVINEREKRRKELKDD